MVCRVDGSTITLTGVVGDNFWDDGFTSGDVITALAMIGAGNPVTVQLNSGGGYATEGAAIYSALKGHGAPVTVIVQGIAASAASLIAMAGETVIMSLGSVMMIHDPSTITWGTAADHQRTIDMLNALATSYAGIYAAKSGGTIEAMRGFMRDELWMTPEEAVAKGFADQVESASNDNQAVEASAFAYGVYARAPEPLRALANAKGWKPRGPTMAAPTAHNPQQPKAETPPKEPTMTDAAEAVKAERTRAKGIMTSPEAKGREALAEHFAYETDMSVEAAIAALKLAPVASADEAAPPESFEDRKARMQDPDGLGLPGKRPSATAEKAEKARAGWGKAVAHHNAAVKASAG